MRYFLIRYDPAAGKPLEYDDDNMTLTTVCCGDTVGGIVHELTQETAQQAIRPPA